MAFSTGGAAMTLTVLSENTANPQYPDLKVKHGLAVHVELDDYRILYDFGSKGTLVPNSRILGVKLEEVNEAILSHGHHDHGGGLESFLKINKTATVYHGRDAFAPRWSISKGAAREVGLSFTPGGPLVERLSVVDKLDDRDAFIILPAAPGHWAKPKGNSLLLAGPAGERLQDDFVDELTLVIRGSEGLIVLTGCSHRGILNIVEQVKTYCPDCPITALIGGFHLRDGEESETDVAAVCSHLAESLPESRIFSGHCTEEKAGKILADTFTDRYRKLYSGMIMTF